nr:MAG TPA: hypothetical protein [Bacteriophage sp.]
MTTVQLRYSAIFIQTGIVQNSKKTLLYHIVFIIKILKMLVLRHRISNLY